MLCLRLTAGLSLGLSLLIAAGCAGPEFSTGSSSGDASVDASAVSEDGGLGDEDGGLPPLVLEASVIGGVSIVPPSGLTTSEDGDQAAFEVVLVNEPTAEVVIALESDAPDEGVLAMTELVFDEDNWNVPRSVVVTGQDDDNVDGDQRYAIRTQTVRSDDPQYDGVNPADVQLVNLDNDEVGIRFVPAEGLVTTEGGGQANFTARLSSKPEGDVALFIESSDTSEGTVSPRVLTFTPDNWNSATMVTVTGVDDEDADGPTDYAVVIERIISGDDNYSSLELDAARVALTNVDDDSAGVTVNGGELVTTERGDSATFTVLLNQEPSDDVIIRLSSSDEGEGTVTPSLLTFTPDNWNAPQEVVITGVDDDETDGDQTYTIEIDQALSVDPDYNGLEILDLDVVNVDDESAGFVVSPQTLTVAESGSSNTFQIQINTAPSADVIIGLTVSDSTEGSLDREQVTFTPDDWQEARVVTVSGVDDNESDGPQTFKVLTAPAQSEDDTYRGMNPNDVDVTTLDDDTSGVEISPVMGLVTSEEGDSSEFVVALRTAPTELVTLVLSSNDDSEGTISPTRIEFEPDNWDEPAVVVISGVDDDITDGAQPYTIITELETDDEAYSDVLVPDVLVTNRDDECPVPQIIDDMEDKNLALCPSEGRQGIWIAENAPAGTLQLSVENADRENSDYTLAVRGTPSVIGLPDDSEVFAGYPILAANFSSANMQAPRPFNAEQYEGFRFFAQAVPDAALNVAVVTTDSAMMPVAGAPMNCSFGCTGHFTTEVALSTEWTLIEIPFERLVNVQGDRLDPSRILGLKFALATDADYELLLDDIAFY